MKELNKGTLIDLTTGGHAKVIKELGRGGQGIVYLCEISGCQYALKWYTAKYEDVFYQNLKRNIDAGSPSKSSVFLWPLILTKKQFGSFGYIMELRQPEYKDFGLFLLGKVKFASASAILNAAFKICDGFYHLHLEGYSYQDLNDGNFFVNPQTGDLLICDNDNVTAQGDNLGIAGKTRYMAPEVMEGNIPDKYSDYFSLAVILFLLFFRNHPFEGAKVLKVPCLTEEGEKKHFGKEALFIYDRNNPENRPVRGVHMSVISLWTQYPDVLQEAFIEIFSQKYLKSPSKRIEWKESRWKSVLVELRNCLIVKENGSEAFISIDKAKYSLKTNRNGTIMLSPKKYVYIGPEQNPIAVVRSNKKNPNLWALQNLHKDTWMVETPSGKLKEVAEGEMMPTKKGLKITFPNGERGIIQ